MQGFSNNLDVFVMNSKLFVSFVNNQLFFD